MDNTRTHTEPTWQGLIQRVAALRFRNDRTRVAELAGIMRENDQAKVGRWLSGYDVPRTVREHETLMHALGLTEHEADLPLNMHSGPRWQKAQMRGEIEALWADERLLPPKEPPQEEMLPRVRNGVPKHRKPNMGQKDYGKPTESYPGFPQRLQPQRDYERMNSSALEDVMAQTPNAHEFIAAFRHRYFHENRSFTTLSKLDISSKKTFDSWENGQNLPAEKLGALKRLVEQKAGFAMAERFEDLVIGNRLFIAHCHDNGKLSKNVVIGEHLSFMPARYWQYVINECNARHGKEEASVASPPWAADIFPIHTKGDYLRAMRMSHMGRGGGLHEHLGLSVPYYRLFEEGMMTLQPSQLETVSAQLPGFNMALYENLPNGKTRFADVIAQRQQAEADCGPGRS